MFNKNLKIPNHIAFIMDGNGRWATKRGIPRTLGHKEGVNAIERTILAALKFKIKYITFYCFSTENWKRSKDEVDGIFSLLRDYLKRNDNIFIKYKIKLDFIGVLDPFPEDLRNALINTKNKTTGYGDNLTVYFALNYGGRDEIVRAVNKIIKNGNKSISESDFSRFLDTAWIPDPDFVVRTSGEERLSNFLLYQVAYSELYFPSIYWPDFNEKQLLKAIKVYSKRNRRYGGV